MQHRPGTGRQSGQVRLVRTGQAFSFGDAGGELFPADRGCDRAVQVHAARLGLDQRRPEFSEQPDLVVDRPGVAQHCAFLAYLGAAEHAADRPVEQGDAVIGQAYGRVQDRGDEGSAATQRRQHAQMLGGEACALAGQLA